MTDTGQRNSMFLGRCHSLMREGYGYEDIAVKLKVDAAVVRFEADLLRKEGRLDDLYREWRAK